MTTTEVKEEQKVYVRLPPDYDDGKHILSWALSNFPKDETQIIVTSIIPPLSANYSVARLNQLRERINRTLDKHLTRCAIQKFKAEKLIHENGDVVEVGILELIEVRAIKNLVMWLYPDSQISAIVAEKANPSCKIWFLYEGNLLFTRNPKPDLTVATSRSEEIDPGLNIALHLSLETELQRREKLHQNEIEEIRKRENDKNDLLKRENEQLKLENQLQRNELRELISDLEIDYNKLKRERDNAIKEAQELRRQKEYSFGNSDMVLGSQFSLRELKQATENFSDSLKIGEGGFGCVYKGSLRKTTVAIKKLNSESLQGLSEFQQEENVH